MRRTLLPIVLLGCILPTMLLAIPVDSVNKPNVVSGCRNLTACSTCASFSHCVWCATENACVEGTSNGPSEGQFGDKSACSDFSFRVCRDQPCSYYNTCASCTLLPVCGWCADTLQCSEATPRGTPAGRGELSCGRFMTQHCLAKEPDNYDQ
eukprot:c23182_g1_i1.p1 GENE.c23182_g1_i1~~c23182_g1_i1.p1  ORF type:complete len:159 (-),score=23.48 c23182_g1_i1:126-581(-)